MEIEAWKCAMVHVAGKQFLLIATKISIYKLMYLMEKNHTTKILDCNILHAPSVYEYRRTIFSGDEA